MGGSTVGFHVVVGVIAVLYGGGKTTVGAGTARPLEEDEKQKRLHRRFLHLLRRSILERGRDRFRLWDQNQGEKLLDEQNER